MSTYLYCYHDGEYFVLIFGNSGGICENIVTVVRQRGTYKKAILDISLPSIVFLSYVYAYSFIHNMIYNKYLLQINDV